MSARKALTLNRYVLVQKFRHLTSFLWQSLFLAAFAMLPRVFRSKRQQVLVLVKVPPTTTTQLFCSALIAVLIAEATSQALKIHAPVLDLKAFGRLSSN
jgi:hypothetical protein